LAKYNMVARLRWRPCCYMLLYVTRVTRRSGGLPPGGIFGRVGHLRGDSSPEGLFPGMHG